MASLFDVLIIVLVILSPFLLPRIARMGPIYRIAAGVTAIGIGLLLAVVFFFTGLIDWEKHWRIANFIEIISYMLLPISLFLFVAGPVLYIAFLGIRILINKQHSAQFWTTTKKFSLGIAVVLLGIYVMFWSLLASSDRFMGEHSKNMNEGTQAYNAHDFPAAQEHYLAALKAAEDFGKGSSFFRFFGLRPSDETTTNWTIKDARLTESLEALAEVYEAQGQYEKAEPLIKRSLSIKEQRRFPIELKTIEKYATLLRKIGRDSEAAPLEDRAKTIRQKQELFRQQHMPHN